ncbi:MAG: hypothetical protein ACW9XA_06390 [Candidatus Nitrosopumilus sp. bin_6a]
MMKRKFILKILSKVNSENISLGIDSFNKAIQDFGDSMDSITREFSADIEKSNGESRIREEKNKENLDKIWGKRR